jgi:hypothetical protein
VNTEFELAEAYWRIEWLTPSRAQSAALDAVAAGYDCAALYELLDGGFGTAAETYELFARLVAGLRVDG